MTKAYQSRDTAQIWLREIIKFPVEFSSYAASGPPLVRCVVMESEGNVMQLGAEWKM